MQLVFPDDPHQMNWFRPDYPYADVRLGTTRVEDGEDQLSWTVDNFPTETGLTTTVTITNKAKTPYFAREGDIGITFPLEDRYDLGDHQTTQRCHAHLFCAGTSSYVLGLRMGAEAPHLGMVLTDGSLSSYSVERDTEALSNDRGCFILNVSPTEIAPRKSIKIAWEIFPFTDQEDFIRRAAQIRRHLHAQWDRYVLFQGETATLEIIPEFAAKTVSVNGKAIVPNDEGRYLYTVAAHELGEATFQISADEQTLTSTILTKVPFDELIEKRCLFIAQHQQYHGKNKHLQGAFLVYDNDEERIFYSARNDFNAGRERVGMGVLLAEYLVAITSGEVRTLCDTTVEVLQSSLEKFKQFVYRELVNTDTGEVFNDFMRDDSFHRLYNAPWLATFFLDLYALEGGREHVLLAKQILSRYYQDGGTRFYPLQLPVVQMCRALEAEGLTDDMAQMRAHFIAHANQIMDTGHNYPPSEVNYEQSIVAPAVDILLKTYEITGQEEFLDAAHTQIPLLNQFQGMQADYRLNEVSIRHWDGYWFGKNQVFGDTLPHYWSGLAGGVFHRYAKFVPDSEYAQRTERALRAVLPMIFDNGRASCARLAPLTVNGERTNGYDPYANDQDWALVFSLQELEALGDYKLRENHTKYHPID